MQRTSLLSATILFSVGWGDRRADVLGHRWDRCVFDSGMEFVDSRIAGDSFWIVQSTAQHHFSTASLRLVVFDPEVSDTLGLQAMFRKAGSLAAEVFGDRRRFCNGVYGHHAYGGHQFGSWRQLGDGRAITVGLLTGTARNGSRVPAPVQALWEIGIKGTGTTPFSRTGDGRAVLQSACREFLGGVALAALGVPTSRSLAVVAASADFDGIVRDEFYTGNP